MTTPMRWADSDSEGSEDEYNVNEESSEASEPETVQISEANDNCANRSSPTYSGHSNHGGTYHMPDNNYQRQHQQQSYNSRFQQKGGKQSFGGGRGKNKPHQHNQNRVGSGHGNWKQLAKASSRFSSDSGNNSSGNIDGSAWMAQRRAKMEQEAQEQKRKEAERLQREEEQKQSRRRSQMSALKAAMHEIKHKQVDEVSQKEAAITSGATTLSSSKVQILKKENTNTTKNGQSNHVARSGNQERNSEVHGERKNTATKGSWRRAKPSASPTPTTSKVSSPLPPPPKYSYTIGQSPSASTKQQKKPFHKAELRPDRSSVKFSRNRPDDDDDYENHTFSSNKKDTKKDAVETNAKEKTANEAIQPNPKSSATNNTVSNAVTGAEHVEKEYKEQRVIVAFDDASGHPSTEKKQQKKNKNNKQNKLRNDKTEDEAKFSSQSETLDEINDEDVASTKTSSSRGSSTLHSCSRGSRGGGGAKHRGRNNPHRRDGRNGRGGRGRGREGRGAHKNSSTIGESSGNEGDCSGNRGNDERRGVPQNVNRGGRLIGRDGNRRDPQRGRGRSSASSYGGNDGTYINEKGIISGGRGERGDNGRGGRGRISGRGGRGGQRSSGKESSLNTAPKYSYEIGKN